MVKRVGILMSQKVVKPFVLSCEGFMLGFTSGGRELLGHPDHLIVGKEHLGKGTFGFVKKGAFNRELGMLFQEADA